MVALIIALAQLFVALVLMLVAVVLLVAPFALIGMMLYLEFGSRWHGMYPSHKYLSHEEMEAIRAAE
jgi:hypothetical protein